MIARRMFCALTLLYCFSNNAFAARDVCEVCEKEILTSVYSREDKMSHEKRFLCADCIKLPHKCYLCGIPVLHEFTTLPDGRVLCKRDKASVVLDESVAVDICEEVRSQLDRQFVRFISFPQTNIQIGLMDRITLQGMFKTIGNDVSCPNTLGRTRAVNKQGGRAFEINILSGLPREDLITTFVHEMAHTWIMQNIPRTRMSIMGKDAIEGFCELLSYRFAEAHDLKSGMAHILGNHYTRGQIHLFIEADRQFGFDQVVDWMKWGEDPLLRGDDLGRLRRLDLPSPIKPAVASNNATRASNHTHEVATPAISNAPSMVAPAKLVLQGIIWSKTRPMATINGKNLEPNEEATIELSNGATIVRCVEIRQKSVVVQTNRSTENLVLELK